MRNRCGVLVLPLLCGLLAATLSTGCTRVQKHFSGATHNDSFIVYWPPSKESQAPRLAVKDLIDMKGVVTTAGSEHRAKNSLPATRDAKCLAIARRRNVQIVGKVNLSEFALMGSGMNEYFGTPRNPLKRGRIPGGSSSGSAVAVANGWADVSFGTDTAGSIRVPAACCGIAGLKTTYGLVSLDGVYPIAPDHLDTVGPMARDVAGLALGMDLLEEGFSTKYQAAVAKTPSPKSIKVGRLYIEGTDPAVDRAVDEALAAAGFTVVKLSDSLQQKWDKAEKDGQTIAHASAWLNNQQYAMKPGIERKTKGIILSGELVHRRRYAAALRGQVTWRRELKQVFENVDFIALPTIKGAPLKLHPFDGTFLFELRALDQQNTEALNLSGNPALALPIPAKGLPVRLTSLQLVGPPRSEAQLLNAGRLVETAL